MELHKTKPNKTPFSGRVGFVEGPSAPPGPEKVRAVPGPGDTGKHTAQVLAVRTLQYSQVGTYRDRQNEFQMDRELLQLI